MAETKIPKATAKRLPIYYRYLNILFNAGKQRVSSTELSEAVQVDSATIRRDFSYFGALGKRGYGYDVENLLNFFKKTLNQDRLTNVALIGVGNLGHALLNYNFQQTNSVRISAAFDINKDIANTIQSGVPVYPMAEMKKQLQVQQINVAILTVPIEDAQKVTDELVSAGVKGVMNFTPIRISVPSTVRVQNVDLANELQTLIYFLDHYGSETPETKNSTQA
ncbi:redox-sensing transcriptional repressor Rex [Loigolactobacillus rennini]|uniref:Redox-sensing transcriptional repressor Rex n=2 Tax=Loigolactobacillus rennini TaxID=238013 RepID=A0A0R2CU20_9LACO|nr:redox-sensing transcriptional repressor Rex [Loigolactobacillus rennini]KRM94896.1 redox-sensing transcriptional repressor Rex [Loigolactobacillus rennini DSM 20253]SFZ87786.1 Redox-sensitive transcriptional regulator (AT-rich DNA-binding protein) [Loigolactobacillus rennini]